MAQSQTRPVQLSDLLADAPADRQWELTIKAQLGSALVEFLLPADCPSRKFVVTKPPAIDPIPLIEPNIEVLRLMDAPDNLADGAGELMEAVMRQLGISPEQYVSRVQILEGDVGTCRNVESLRQKRVPAAFAHEGLENIIGVAGPAHTAWNMERNIHSAHYGNPRDSENTGAWRVLDSLGWKTDKPVANLEFNIVTRQVHQVHKASLFFCLR